MSDYKGKDIETLRSMLDASTDFEERRKIRAAIRETRKGTLDSAHPTSSGSVLSRHGTFVTHRPHKPGSGSTGQPEVHRDNGKTVSSMTIDLYHSEGPKKLRPANGKGGTDSAKTTPVTPTKPRRKSILESYAANAERRTQRKDSSSSVASEEARRAVVEATKKLENKYDNIDDEATLNRLLKEADKLEERISIRAALRKLQQKKQSEGKKDDARGSTVQRAATVYSRSTSAPKIQYSEIQDERQLENLLNGTNDYFEKKKIRQALADLRNKKDTVRQSAPTPSIRKDRHPAAMDTSNEDTKPVSTFEEVRITDIPKMEVASIISVSSDNKNDNEIDNNNSVNKRNGVVLDNNNSFVDIQNGNNSPRDQNGSHDRESRDTITNSEVDKELDSQSDGLLDIENKELEIEKMKERLKELQEKLDKSENFEERRELRSQMRGIRSQIRDKETEIEEDKKNRANLYNSLPVIQSHSTKSNMILQNDHTLADPHPHPGAPHPTGLSPTSSNNKDCQVFKMTKDVPMTDGSKHVEVKVSTKRTPSKSEMFEKDSVVELVREEGGKKIAEINKVVTKQRLTPQGSIYYQTTTERERKFGGEGGVPQCSEKEIVIEKDSYSATRGETEFEKVETKIISGGNEDEESQLRENEDDEDEAFPDILEPLEHVSAVDGTKAVFECTLSLPKGAKVLWYFNDKLLRNSADMKQTLNEKGVARLELAEVYPDDAGEYKCVAKTPTSEAEVSAYLTVLDNKDLKVPTFLKPLTNMEVDENEAVKLSCQLTGKPQPKVHWLFNDKQIKGDPGIRHMFAGKTATLTISAMDESRAGEYTCVAQNKAGESQCVCTVKVKPNLVMPSVIQPSLVHPLQDLTVKDAETVNLTCTICGQPAPRITWMCNGQIIKNDPDFRQTYKNSEAKLCISEVFNNDEGEYTCIAENEAGKVFTTCILTVQETNKPPSRTPTPPQETVQLSVPPVAVTSNIEEPLTNETIVTLAENKVNVPTEQIGTVSNLVIQTNSSESSSSDSKLERVPSIESKKESHLKKRNSSSPPPMSPISEAVSSRKEAVSSKLEAPQFTEYMDEIVAKCGVKVTFECPLPDVGQMKVNWYKNDSVLEADDIYFHQSYDGTMARLTIDEVFEEDSGIYSCIAKNPAGEDKVEAELTVEVPKTEPPTEAPPPLPPKFEFTVPLRDTVLIDSKPGVIECTLTYPNEEPQIVWYKNTRVLRQTMDIKQTFKDGVAKVEFTEVFFDDEGIYKCVAKSEEDQEIACVCKVTVRDNGTKPETKSSNAETTKTPEAKPVEPTTEPPPVAILVNTTPHIPKQVFKSASATDIPHKSHPVKRSQTFHANSGQNKITMNRRDASPIQRAPSVTNHDEARSLLSNMFPTMGVPGGLKPDVKDEEDEVDSAKPIIDPQPQHAHENKAAPAFAFPKGFVPKKTEEDRFGRLGGGGVGRSSSFRQAQEKFGNLEKNNADTAKQGKPVLRSASFQPRPVTNISSQGPIFSSLGPTRMANIDQIDDEELLHKMLNETENFDERRKIRHRLKDIREKKAAEWENSRIEREAMRKEAETMRQRQAEADKQRRMNNFAKQAREEKKMGAREESLREKIAAADRDKMQTIENLKEMGKVMSASYHAEGDRACKVTHQAADQLKNKALNDYKEEAILRSTRSETGIDGVNRTTTTTTTTIRSRDGGTTVTKQTKQSTAVGGFGGVAFGGNKGVEEKALRLAKEYKDAVNQQTSGTMTVKTESWHSGDPVTKRTQKTTSWGGGSNSLNAGGGGSAVQRSPSTIKAVMLEWCKRQVAGYENVNVTNFSSSWNDGMAFCALIHRFYPQAFDFKRLNPKARRGNFTLAFKTAEKYADIAPLLDVDDMVAMKNPDWKCVFTYVQSFYRRFRNWDEEQAQAQAQNGAGEGQVEA